MCPIIVYETLTGSQYMTFLALWFQFMNGFTSTTMTLSLGKAGGSSFVCFHTVPKSFIHQEISHLKLAHMDFVIVKLLTYKLVDDDILSNTKYRKKWHSCLTSTNWCFLIPILCCSWDNQWLKFAYIHPIKSITLLHKTHIVCMTKVSSHNTTGRDVHYPRCMQNVLTQ